MKNLIKSVVIIYILLVCLAASANVQTHELKPLSEHRTTTQHIVDALASRHYVKTALDNDLSAKIYEAYLDNLDPSKSYFLRSDIDEFEPYRFKLDNALRSGNLAPAFEIFNRYHERVINRLEKVIAQLESEFDAFDFELSEQLLVDRELAHWASTQKELDDLWRKRLKDAILNLKLTDKEPVKIQELLVKRFKNRLARTQQTNAEDVFQIYMNSFTNTYDPHTQYFSPRTSENFNINMSLSLEGIGVHTGLKAKIDILPAQPNTGIIFKRIDIKKNNIIIPNYSNVVDATLCTTISNYYGVKVSTIEHLMGAFYGLGIDNAIVEINSQEVPIMDGSAKVFVEKFLDVGFKKSNLPIKIIKIKNNVNIKDGSKFISIDKSNVSLEIDFEIKYLNSFIGSQKNKINVYENDLSNIYNSRTFCLYEDVEKLREIGLAKGGSLDNAIVVKDNEVLNNDGLRNELEFVNHKILDCMGDLYLSGYKIIGSLKCSQGGHMLTNQLLRKVFDDDSNFSIFEVKEKTIPNIFLNKKHLRSIA